MLSFLFWKNSPFQVFASSNRGVYPLGNSLIPISLWHTALPSVFQIFFFPAPLLLFPFATSFSILSFCLQHLIYYSTSNIIWYQNNKFSTIGPPPPPPLLIVVLSPLSILFLLKYVPKKLVSWLGHILSLTLIKIGLNSSLINWFKFK